MFKSILAVSEGGPDATMSFAFAHRVATVFDGTVDAMHLVAGSGTGLLGIDFTSTEDLDARAARSARAYEEILASLQGATYTAETTIAPLEALVLMGRVSDVIVLGRPSTDPATATPAAINTALHECARAVMIAPPIPSPGPFESVVLAWNGSFEATRAVEHAMPFLVKASEITILVVGKHPDDVAASLLARNLQRHGLTTRIDAIDADAVSGRARGRALVGYTRDARADLLVMGSFGDGKLANFLGLGGATSKVISSCPVPVLMAH
jgi:nucleotide-binding universal stress UspA family protein